MIPRLLRILTASAVAAVLPAQSRPAPGRLLWSGEPLAGGIERCAVAPDGRRAATSGEDGRLLLWDLATFTASAAIEGAGAYGNLLAFSPDGELAATQVPHWRPPPGLRVFRARDGVELTGWKHVPLGAGQERSDRDARWREGPELWLHPDGATVFHPGDYRSLVVSATRRLAPGPVARGQRWRVADSGDRVAVLTVEGLQGGPVPEGKQRNTIDLRVYRVPGGDETGRLAWQRDQARDVPHPVDVCTFDFRELALGVDGAVVVLGFPGGEELYRFGSGVTALTQDGARRWTGHRDGTVRCWEQAREVSRAAALAEPVRTLEVSGNHVLVRGEQGGVAALRDGHRWLVDTSGEIRSSGRWTVLREPERIRAFGSPASPGAAAPVRELRIRDRRDGSFYGADDDRSVPIAIAGDRLVFRGNGRLCVYDLERGVLLAERSGHHAAVDVVEWPFAEQGAPRTLLVKDFHQAAQLRLDGAPAGPVYPDRHVHFAGAHVVAFHELVHQPPWRVATARTGVFAFRDGARVRVCQAPEARVLLEPDVGGAHGDALALSDDGALLACTSSEEGRGLMLSLWDVSKGGRLARQRLEARSAELMVFSPDKRWLVVRTDLMNNVLIDATTGKVVRSFHSGPAAMGEEPEQRSFAWTPDSREILTTSHACEIAGWDVVAGKETFAWPVPDETYSHFAQLVLAPAGGTFVTLHSERDLVFAWSRSPGAGRPLRVATTVRAHTAGFLPDGTLLVATERGLERYAGGTLARVDTITEARGDQVFVAPGGELVAVTGRSRLSIWALRD